MKLVKVNSRIYRSDQPLDHELPDLRAAGIDTIVNLRRERRAEALAQKRVAEALGMRFFNFRFYGVFGATTAFLDRVLTEVAREDNGVVLVHCKNGSDRTSLVIGLYRVLFEGWDPQLTWEREFVAHGHDPNNPRTGWNAAWKLFFFRNVGRTFWRHLRRSRFTRARPVDLPQNA